jgi:N-hydroxyarylamine O-acetyltransferase
MGSEAMMDTHAYLRRIAYRGTPTVSAATLHDLHVAHLLSTPFENLDILRRRALALDEAALFDKIVRRRRGGVCYEHNGLFALLLRALGFTVQLLAARDVHPDGTLGPEFDHLALHVETDGPWLADVGWGDQFVRPLRLDTPEEQDDGRQIYRIRNDGNGIGRVVERQTDPGVWEALYCFGPEPHAFAEFAPAFHYHQTSPVAPFTRRRLCTQLTEEGRLTLSEAHLIVVTRTGRSEQELADEVACTAVLAERFGIVLS